MERPGFKPYPKWLHEHETPDGIKRIVNSREEHEAILCRPVNEDGTVVVDDDPPEDHSKPPSIELILSRGYSQNVAELIHAQEQAKFEKGYPPYGDNVEPPAPAVPPPDAAHPPTQEEREAVFAPESVQPGQTTIESIVRDALTPIGDPQPEVPAPTDEQPKFISRIEKTGIRYIDLEEKLIAFLSYDTLDLTDVDKDSALLPLVLEYAAKVQAKRGQKFDLGEFSVTLGQPVEAVKEAKSGDGW